MGCCVSRPSGPNAPYPGASNSAHSIHASSRAINPSAPVPLPTLSQDTITQPQPRRRHRRPLDQHINKPLRRHRWVSSPEKWTPHAIDVERAAFFDTRVSGRPEVWQCLRAALEILWEADRLPASDSDDGGRADLALATAQSILDAAEVILPTGDLKDGVYDALGNYYGLPEGVVSDPVDIDNVATAGETDEQVKDDAKETKEIVGDKNEDEQRREEKGKSVVDRRAQIAVIVRMSDTGRDLRVKVGKEEAVASVARRLREETGHAPSSRIRLVSFGKILKEGEPLLAQGWEKGHVLSAFVYDVPEGQT